MPDDTETIGRYDEDYYVWALSQARALRSAGAALAGARANDWRDTLSGLDWENLAEEIESLGRRELGSQIETIIEHLAKLQYSPAQEPRLRWQETIDRSCDAIETILRDSPSLRAMVPTLIDEVRDRGVRLASRSLKRHGEGPRSALLVLCEPSYTPDQILTDWWPESPTVDDRLDKTTKTEPNP